MQNEDATDGVRPKQKKANSAPKVVIPQPQRETDGSPGTAKLSTAKLQSGAETTTVLHQNANETTVLAQSANETTVLRQGVQDLSCRLLLNMQAVRK